VESGTVAGAVDTVIHLLRAAAGTFSGK